MKRTTYEQFDAVRITTTKNVNWLMDLPGQVPDPNGVWHVVCTYPKYGELLVQKNTAMARVPISDVVKVANYSLEKVFDSLSKTSEKYLKKPEKLEEDDYE